MTPQPAPQPHPYPWYASRILLVVACILFIFAALAFGGASILSASGWQWLAAGFAAWVLSGAVP